MSVYSSPQNMTLPGGLTELKQENMHDICEDVFVLPSWSGRPQCVNNKRLEASGTGGAYPNDLRTV